MVLFGNKTARAFKIREKSQFRMSLTENHQEMEFDLDSKLFTPLNVNVLNQDFQSASKLSEYLKNENNYISINEIIHQQLEEDDRPHWKSIYKQMSIQQDAAANDPPCHAEASTSPLANEKFFAIKIRQ